MTPGAFPAVFGGRGATDTRPVSIARWRGFVRLVCTSLSLHSAPGSPQEPPGTTALRVFEETRQPYSGPRSPATHWATCLTHFSCTSKGKLDGITDDAETLTKNMFFLIWQTFVHKHSHLAAFSERANAHLAVTIKPTRRTSSVLQCDKTSIPPFRAGSVMARSRIVETSSLTRRESRTVLSRLHSLLRGAPT